MPAPQSNLTLVTVSGPVPVSFMLSSATAKRYSIGRRSSHALVLDRPEVSKDHAALVFHEEANHGRWCVVDLGSRHGTRVNGVALEPQRDCPIAPGDLIEIAPWTFCVMDQSSSIADGSRINTIDDTIIAGSTVTSIRAEAGRELAHERLRLLLHCAEALQQARDEKSLAEIVLNAAIAGTGYSNAAVTRPMTPDGAIELIVGQGEISASSRSPRMSRSLIKAASHGVPVQLMGAGQTIHEAVSIAEFGIQEAICVPLMIESTVAGFLYLDNRRRFDGGTIAANEACAFAVGIGRLASMAWANLMRLELERRYARIEGELSAAARAQQLILPRREGCCGAVQYIGECKPGRVVSGDFFDVFALPDQRVVITIGDVAGKGMAASVVMTTAQGFLHGALRQHGDLGRAIQELNQYVYERCESQIFLTMWAGIFDLVARTVEYTDAGHGYAWMVQSSGEMTRLDGAGGPPIAASFDTRFQTATAPLDVGGRVVLVSDGIIEQPAPLRSGPSRDEFGRKRVEEVLRSIAPGADEVAALFQAVTDHAQTAALADDATIVVARW